MKVLTVCSINSGKISPFITEQVNALIKLGIEVDFFTIKKKGLLGYLGHLPALMRVVKRKKYDLIHAHYGLSGLLATLQRSLPVVITFHGSDINNKKVLPFSRLGARLSAYNIVVESGFGALLGQIHKTMVIPCGVDFDTFFVIEKNKARELLHISPDEKIVLFSSHFGNAVKNYPLARQAVDKLGDTRLVELKNFTRSEVNTWMNAADALLVTSYSEGSPQVVKEALTCRLPVISTPVGDVSALAQQTKGIQIVPYDSDAIALTLRTTLSKNGRTKDNSLIYGYDNHKIARSINQVYNIISKVSSR